MGMYVSEITPVGRGAVATVRIDGDLHLVDGPPPLWCAANGRTLGEQPSDRVCFGRWGTESPEDVVVCRMAKDVAEVHCHGGRAAVARILSELVARGAVVVSPEQLMCRGLSVIDAECRRALLRATTERTAVLLAEQAGGVLRGDLERIDGRLATVGAAASAARTRAAQAIDRLLSWSWLGLHLTTPWSVVLCGQPNVGKSSLVNALAGFTRSIVSPLPGTTRDVVTTPVVFDGWPIELCDTAGLRETGDAIESAGVARATSRLATADLVVLLLDGSQPLTTADVRLLGEWPQAVVVRHKCDLPQMWESVAEREPDAVSAATGAGVPELIATIVARLVPRVPDPGVPLPASTRIVTTLTDVRAALQVGDLAAARRSLHTLLSKP